MTLNTLPSWGIVWLLLVAGVAFGWAMPDLDLRLQPIFSSHLVLHRSILTHTFLVPALLCWLALRRDRLWLRLFTIGMSLALAVHFSFDLFPRGWQGFALIHVPFLGWTSAVFSVAWLVLCVILCLYLAYRLIHTVVDILIVVGGEIILAGQHALKEPHIAFSALLVLVIATVMVLILPMHPGVWLRKELRRRRT